MNGTRLPSFDHNRVSVEERLVKGTSTLIPEEVRRRSDRPLRASFPFTEGESRAPLDNSHRGKPIFGRRKGEERPSRGTLYDRPNLDDAGGARGSIQWEIKRD